MTTNDKTREALAGEFAMSKFASSSDRCRALFDEVLRLRAALASTPAQPPVAAVPAQPFNRAEAKAALAFLGLNELRELVLVLRAQLHLMEHLAATPTPAPVAQGDMRNASSLISDLTLLVGRMARRLRITDPGSVHVAGNKALAEQAVEFIKRQRLVSPLRNDCGDEAQGEAVDGAVWDEFNGGVALVKRGHEDAHVSKWGGSRLYRPTPERAEVRPPVLTESYPLADALYRAGYEDRSRGRDYDPRGCLEWQSVVDAITPPSAADSAQGQQQGEA